ncbi:MAG: hypothetical protein HOO93_05245 [Methyloglobulus sp.]|nr:hypothetical protein [Methyloglobulus sp.]
MDSKAIADSLRKLASDKSKRNKTGILREVFDDIEACLAAGISQTDVVKVLNDHGLEMTYGTFGTTLRRLRLQRDKRSTANRQPATRQKADPIGRSDENTASVETEAQADSSGGQPDNQQTIFNPSDLRELLNKKVDLVALAKIGKELNRKRKHEKRGD